MLKNQIKHMEHEIKSSKIGMFKELEQEGKMADGVRKQIKFTTVQHLHQGEVRREVVKPDLRGGSWWSPDCRGEETRFLT